MPLRPGNILFNFRATLLCCLVSAVLVQSVSAQAPKPATTGQNANATTTNLTSTPGHPVINLNLDLNNFSNDLPFDVDFKIAGGATGEKVTTDQIVSIDLYYANKTGVTAIPADRELTDPDKWKHLEWVNRQTSNLYMFDIKALPPNQPYTFIFKYKRVLTDDEKTKLTKFIQPLVLPLLRDKAKHNDLHFSIEQSKKAVKEIQDRMTIALTADGLTANFAEANGDQAKAMYSSIEDITEAYAKELNDQEKIKTIAANLDKQDQIAVGLYNQYDAGTDPNKQKIMAALEAVHQAAAAVKPPAEAQVGDAAQMKIFTDAIAALATALKSTDLQATEPMKKMVQDMKDISGSLNDRVSRFATDLSVAQTTLNNKLFPFIETISKTLYSNVTLAGSSTPGEFVTRSNRYVSADLGVAVMPDIARLTPYIGTNIYLRPINFDAPLRWSDKDWFRRRFSFVVGVSVASVARTNVRTDLLGGSFNLMTGVGFRLMDWVHIGGGYLFYSRNDPNPLNTNQQIAGTPYITLSFDLRIKTALNNLFNSSVLNSVSP